MPIWQLCANLLIPNCLRSNLSYSPLTALELYVNIYNPAVDVFKRFKIASSEGITLDNWVAEILSDSLDNIWVLIPDQGLFRYKDGKVHHYSLIDKDNLKIIIRNVFVSMSRAKYG